LSPKFSSENWKVPTRNIITSVHSYEVTSGKMDLKKMRLTEADSMKETSFLKDSSFEIKFIRLFYF
jgi:hypothetical protein